MHYVQALISLGLFGWLGYAVAFDALPYGEAGSSKTRTLRAAADTLTDQMGAAPAGALIAGAGILLAAFFLSRTCLYDGKELSAYFQQVRRKAKL